MREYLREAPDTAIIFATGVTIQEEVLFKNGINKLERKKHINKKEN